MIVGFDHDDETTFPEVVDFVDRARLDGFFQRYTAALLKNDDYWIEHEPGGRLNNHYAWHKLGLSMIGVFYDRPEHGRHYVRFAFCKKRETLEAAVARLASLSRRETAV